MDTATKPISFKSALSAASKLGRYFGQEGILVTPQLKKPSIAQEPRQEFSPKAQQVIKQVIHATGDGYNGARLNSDTTISSKQTNLARMFSNIFGRISRQGFTFNDAEANRQLRAQRRQEQIAKLEKAQITSVKSINEEGITLISDQGEFSLHPSRFWLENFMNDSFYSGKSILLQVKMPDLIKTYDLEESKRFLTGFYKDVYFLAGNDFDQAASGVLPRDLVFKLLLKTFTYINEHMSEIEQKFFNPELDKDVKFWRGAEGDDIIAQKKAWQEACERCEGQLAILKHNVPLLIEAITNVLAK